MPKNVLFFVKGKFLLFLGYLIPIILLVWFVNNFSITVPILDEWAIADLFEKVSNGQLSIGDFFAQHNEHRIIFPKIIIIILAFISQWNLNYELYTNILLSIINFSIIYKIYLNTENAHNQWLGYLVNLITCFTIFSWSQYEIWLSGLGIVWFLTNTFILLAIFTISFNKDHFTVTTKLALAATFCFFASFSAAHGLLSWLALLPSVISLSGNLGQKIRRLSLWIGLWLSSCIIYAIGYNNTGNYHYSILPQKTLSVLAYFFSLLGAPLASGSIESLLIGLICFLNFALFVFYCLRNLKSEFTHQAIPWLSLGLYSLLFALISTIGRGLPTIYIAGGLSSLKIATTTSRYISISALLIISLLQIWRLFISRNSQDSLHQTTIQKKVKFLIYLFTGIISYLTIVKSLHALPHAKHNQLRRQNSQVCLELVHFIEVSSPPSGCLWELYPLAFKLKQYIATLEQMEFRNFPKDLDFLVAPTQAYGAMETPQLTDNFTINKGENKNILFSGWSVIPNQVELPKLVLLSYQGQRSFFTTSYVAFPRPDIAQALNSNQYILSGWSVDYPTESMPLGEQVIQAWVYDKQGKQFVKLQGDIKVLVED
ncbi:MAG: hypothetical protein F6K31_26315 [Symploca sp. SIO2G7]|nr:hypothetical protein [Symploca sp. SIO2G7]